MTKQPRHPAPPDGKEWYSLTQAAEALGIQPQTLGYHIAKKHVAAHKLGPVWLIHISALLAFAGNRKKAGRPPKPKGPPSPGASGDGR